VSAEVFIDAEKASYPVTMLCTAAGISPSRYYQLRKKTVGVRAAEDAELQHEIQAIYREGRGNYGSPRVHDELGKRGFNLSRKRVIRLMNRLGLKAKTANKFKVTTDSRHTLPIAPNLLNRDFCPAGPNRVWVSDITYLRTRTGWLYLAVIIDLYSRRVVGWALRPRMKASLVCDAFDMAARNRKPPPGLIFHTDRGSQYASAKFRRRLARTGALASMSRKGDCWDNAVAESFFATLKKELVRGVTLADHQSTHSAIFEYIEVFYNRRRKHTFVGGISPAQFEACAIQTLAA
jgi:transposase InsO family protein